MYIHVHTCVYVSDGIMIYPCLIRKCGVCLCVCVSVCTKLAKFRFLRTSFLILQKYYAFCSTFDEVTVTEQSRTYLFILFELWLITCMVSRHQFVDACLLTVPPTWLCQVLKCTSRGHSSTYKNVHAAKYFFHACRNILPNALFLMYAKSCQQVL